ncbi:MAG: helicase HerA domain-containing protein [Candidatus Njordarchaeia archaeon]
MLIGFEVGTGAKVEIPLHHTIISGMTGSGKTTLIKRILNQLDKSLLFDVKDDYIEFPTVPPKVTADVLDSLAIKEILEVYGGMNLKGEFPELIKALNGANDLWDVLNKIKEMLEKDSIHPVRKDKLLVIKELLGKFWDDLAPLLTMRRSKNVPKMRIDISPLSEALQQYIVREELRFVENGTTVIIDEAHRFIPERASSISKRRIINLLREGRSRKIFVILSDQTLTGISKQALKQCWNWIMGRQLELNEIKRTTSQVIGKKTEPKEIASLRVGEFIYFSPDEKIRFYSWPPFMDKEEAITKAIKMGDRRHRKRSKNTSYGEFEREKIIMILENIIDALESLIDKIDNIDEEIVNRPRDLILRLIANRPGISANRLQRLVIRKTGLSETNVNKIVRELIENKLITVRKKENGAVFLINHGKKSFDDMFLNG